MRRANSPFNLSLLDLLTAALGAIIFLFIITPKGGQGAAVAQQASIYFDTTTMQIHGRLPDSLIGKTSGDTLFAMLVDYRAINGPDVGGLEAELAAQRRRAAEAEAAEQAALAATQRAQSASERADAARRLAEAKAAKAKAEARVAAAKVKVTKPVAAAPVPVKKTPAKPKAKPTPEQPTYRGTPPSVPARLSFELNWADKNDNVDLFVCQGNNCVFGNRKRDSKIGNWDSGKSRNRLFGNDLRTTQEAVRQFDDIRPGTYTIYAMFKESASKKTSVAVNGLIYTKDAKGKPRGETYKRTVKLAETRTRLITVVVNADGSFTTR
ncbi:MAG: hypothetical protein AB8F78_12400 [Saprospiraceae bacterium]